MNASEQVVRISSREARAKWRDLLDAIYRGSPGIVIERYGKPVAALVSFEDFKGLQQGEIEGNVLKEPMAVYLSSHPTTFLQKMDTTMDNSKTDLQAIVQTLSADAQKLVAEFARFLQPTVQTATPTVGLSAASLSNLTAVLPGGYTGDALADSEALYDV